MLTRSAFTNIELTKIELLVFISSHCRLFALSASLQNEGLSIYCGRVPWDARFSLFAAPVENHARPRVVVQAANENLNKADGFPE